MQVTTGTLLADRYRLTSRAESDLANVAAWSAQDQILDRVVRVALIEGPRAQEALDAARRAALVSDPRLVRIIDVATWSGIHFVVTEPFIGEDLALVTSVRPLSVDNARAVIGEVASALESAQDRGIHHLALRPQVVRIHEGRVQVTGLGTDGTLNPIPRGGPHLAARADTEDLLSLLYFSLTGHWPSHALESIAFGDGVSLPPLALKPDNTPRDPHQFNPDFDAALADLCITTLSSRSEGPHSPAALVTALGPWGAISVTPPRIFSAVHGEAMSGDDDFALLAAPSTTTMTGRAATAALPGAGVVSGAGPAVAGSQASVATGAGSRPKKRNPLPIRTPSAKVPRSDVPSSTPAAEATSGADSATPTSEDLLPTAPSGATPNVSGEPATPEITPDPVVAKVKRQSVHTSFASKGRPGPPPGTPPPAIPPREPGRVARKSVLSPSPVPLEADPAAPALAAEGTGSRTFTSPGSGNTPSVTSAKASGLPVRTSGSSAGSTPAARPNPLTATDAAALHAAAGQFASHDASAGTAPVAASPSPAPDAIKFDELMSAPKEYRRFRFNPTALTLVLAIAMVCFGIFFAFETLSDKVQNPFGAENGERPLDPGLSSPGATTPEVVPPTKAPVIAPIIASGKQLDPEGDDNEHPEAVDLAFDQDPSTFWYTRTYKSPTFDGLGKSGIGFAVKLEQKSPVSTVYLSTNNTGGVVEIRATDPSTPAKGELLASVPLDKEMTIQLRTTVETQHIVLWFPELPQTPDGSNRVELSEIALT